MVVLAVASEAAMIAPRQSLITRLFDEMVRLSTRTGTIRRAPLKNGAELVVLVADGTITLTIKRPEKRVGAAELVTFRRDCRVPADAEVLTPPEQATRHVGNQIPMTVYYVTYRWVQR